VIIDTKMFAPYMKDKKSLYKILAIDGKSHNIDATYHISLMLL